MKLTKNFMLLIALSFFMCSHLKAQLKSETRTATISFQSHTPIEEIYAENNQVASILKVDGAKTVLAFNVIMRSFKFEKALMEEHFNEKYVHSEKFPTAKFIGEFSDDVDLTVPGVYKNIMISGTITLHGTSKSITVPANFEVGTNKEIKGSTKFKIKPQEYDIEIPRMVSEKIAKEIVVTVDALYKPSN
jgi:polyisoprenoid-binding protein YceI